MAGEVFAHVSVPTADAAVQGVREQEACAEHQRREHDVADDRDREGRPKRVLGGSSIRPRAVGRHKQRAARSSHGFLRTR